MPCSCVLPLSSSHPWEAGREQRPCFSSSKARREEGGGSLPWPKATEQVLEVRPQSYADPDGHLVQRPLSQMS